LEGPEIKSAECVIDNGKFGKRTVRFEIGQTYHSTAQQSRVS
jgi:hypothetical protein